MLFNPESFVVRPSEEMVQTLQGDISNPAIDNDDG